MPQLSSVGNGAFRGLQDTRTPLLILLVANLVNFVLDPLFIYGVNINSVDIVQPMGVEVCAGGSMQEEELSLRTCHRAPGWPRPSPSGSQPGSSWERCANVKR